jgi:hypothetical protein
MRLLSGIVLGVALTVGVAFVADNWRGDPAPAQGSAATAAEHRTMVNWGGVGDNLRIVSERAREAWSKLSHKVTG